LLLGWSVAIEGIKNQIRGSRATLSYPFLLNTKYKTCLKNCVSLTGIKLYEIRLIETDLSGFNQTGRGKAKGWLPKILWSQVFNFKLGRFAVMQVVHSRVLLELKTQVMSLSLKVVQNTSKNIIIHWFAKIIFCQQTYGSRNYNLNLIFQHYS
jgi:hypothetical protein